MVDSTDSASPKSETQVDALENGPKNSSDDEHVVYDMIVNEDTNKPEQLASKKQSADEKQESGPDRNPSSNKMQIQSDEPLPTLPLKKARTAYFIFADEKREELKLLHKGEGLAALARATGELWSNLDSIQRKVYEAKAADERERVSRDIQRLKDEGLWPEANSTIGVDGETSGELDDDQLIFPIGRVRKICKLDPDVRGISKESTMLIAKATELFCIKLGKECVTMAQMQNRRKLLPEDIVEVCTIKERFMFLREDLKDLAKEQVKERKIKEASQVEVVSKNVDDEKKVNTLDSYFSNVR